MIELKIHRTGANILHEISSQVYTTLSRQIRELVSNSVDAEASEFVLSVNCENRELVFEDNGNGMTRQEVSDFYCVLSVSPQAINPQRIGRKGVGKFATIGISPRFTLETRARNSNNVFVGRFDYSPTMDPKFANEDLSSLTICLAHERKANKDDPPHFTRITCHDVPDKVLNHFEDSREYENLVIDLARILPLKYPDSHDALDMLVGTVKARFYDPSLRTISVRIISEFYPNGHMLRKCVWGENSQVQEAWGKPYPFEFDLPSANAQVFGYFIDMKYRQDQRWQGLVVRVKNVAVRDHEFFEWDDKPVMGRLTGEVHITGINDQKAITMNRSEFNMSDPVVIEISRRVSEQLNEFGKKMRRRNEVNVEVKKVMKRMKRFRDAIQDIETGWNAHIETPITNGSPTSTLAGCDEVSFEGELRSIDVDEHEVVDVLTYPTPAEGPCMDPEIKIDKNSEVEISIDEALLSGASYFGKDDDVQEWRYELRNGNPEDAPCEIDVDARVIRLNAKHRLIRDVDEHSIRIVVLLYLTYFHYRENCDEMFNRLLEVLV